MFFPKSEHMRLDKSIVFIVNHIRNRYLDLHVDCGVISKNESYPPS